jgi:hypothetical protein
MKFHRANNKRSYLVGVIDDVAVQMELVYIDYDDPDKDRNIPEDVTYTLRLVIWGQQYSNPGIDPDREIVEAVWTGIGHVFDIVRGMEGTVAGSHYIADNVALLYTSDMSWEPCIFDTMLKDTIGSIGYTEDIDADGEAEVEPLVPDNAVSPPENYRKILITGGDSPDPRPFWDWVWNHGAIRFSSSSSSSSLSSSSSSSSSKSSSSGPSTSSSSSSSQSGSDWDHPDADDIVAVYPFETGFLPHPEIKNGQDLTNSNEGNVDVSLDTSDHKEGEKSLLVECYHSGNSFYSPWCMEDDMNSDMPHLEGTSNAVSTIMFWYKYTPYAIPSSVPPADPQDDEQYLEMEVDFFTGPLVSISSYWARDGNLGGYPVDHGGIVSFGGGTHDSTVQKDKWYHYTFWYNGVTGDRKISIWDPVALSKVGSDKEFSEAPDSLPYNYHPFNNPHFRLWYYNDSGVDEDLGEVVGDLRTDELVIAKAWLSDADVLKIIYGAYP